MSCLMSTHLSNFRSIFVRTSVLGGWRLWKAAPLWWLVHALGGLTKGDLSAFQGLLITSSLCLVWSDVGLSFLEVAPLEGPRSIILDLGTQGTHCYPQDRVSPSSFIHVLSINNKLCLLVGFRVSAGFSLVK